ncbi:hypothetical protein HK096_005022 [Nowakowskiella sp. JEL0078]|nr:hypothetical protein HK096_005022 [Nowakowskiella sp. JEL0078]
MKVGETFERLIKQIRSRWIASEIVLVYRSIPITTYVTPFSINLFQDSELEIWQKEDHQLHLEKNKAHLNSILSTNQNLLEHEEIVEEPESDKILIKLSDGKGEPLKVKTSKDTILQKLALHYIEQKDLRVGAEKIRIMFDGETLNLKSCLRDLDVDDEDVLEVRVAK